MIPISQTGERGGSRFWQLAQGHGGDADLAGTWTQECLMVPRGPFPTPRSAWEHGLWQSRALAKQPVAAGESREVSWWEAGPTKVSQLLEKGKAGRKPPRSQCLSKSSTSLYCPHRSLNDQSFNLKFVLCFQSLQNATRIMSLLLLKTFDGSPLLLG